MSSHASQQPKSQIYIIDFLNVFSDYREIKYKQQNIDFHSVKHKNKDIDTIAFFDFFFKKYVDYIKINKNNPFIFILKKISNYETLLYSILETYQDIDIRFIVIETKFNNDILDKNKDDFLCQYMFNLLLAKNDCIMISNDKYRDRNTYVKQFQERTILPQISIIKKTDNKIEKKTSYFNSQDIIICNNILTQQYKRTVIPKNQLKNIL